MYMTFKANRQIGNCNFVTNCRIVKETLSTPLMILGSLTCNYRFDFWYEN